MIFAAAASQNEFLDALAEEAGIDWSRVVAFHLDEYVGLPLGDERSFGEWLERRFWSRVRPGRIEKLDGGAAVNDPEAECGRYGRLLANGGIDLALLGVGENGHLAFNDPHVADFDDPLVVKPVEIDDTSRLQQVRDGAFVRAGRVFDEAGRLHELLLQPAVGVAHKVQELRVVVKSFHHVVPDDRRAYRPRDLEHLRVVAVAHPHADRQVGRVAHGPAIAVVVGGAGLGRCREAHL